MTTQEFSQGSGVADLLQPEQVSLLAEAGQVIDDMHAAVLAEDKERAQSAVARYEEIVNLLNGGTPFGSYDTANPKAGGVLAEKHHAAELGTVPKWGQTGEFLVNIGGMSVHVKASQGFGRMNTHFEFFAVNLHEPFISNTGYKSYFLQRCYGFTVQEAAEEIIKSMVSKKSMIDSSYMHKLQTRPAPAWLATQPACSFADASGQIGFFF